MRANLIGMALGLCVVTFLWVSGYGTSIVERFNAPDAYESALAHVLSCTTKGESAVCVRPAVIEMLKLKSAAEIVSALSVRLKPQQCHYVGHVVGQQLYTLRPEVETALAQCNRACDSACIHGVIGQTFAVELGYPDPDIEGFDLKHLSPTEVSRVGKQLCFSAGACHGVGHALFQAYAEFAPAFAMCRQIGGASITTCYNGVTMEYADILSARNMRVVSDVEFPKAEELNRLCIFPRIEETRACFRYFPRIVEETLERDGIDQSEAQTQTRRICESYTSADQRISCFAGIGSHAAYAVLTDTSVAVEKCDGFSRVVDQEACVLGIVSVATGDRMTRIAEFCAAQKTETVRAVCYQALFYTLNSGGAEMDVPLLCGSNNSVCENAAKQYEIDSWQYIKKAQ